MNKEITLLDGALGTMLWELSGTSGDVWELNMTQKNVVKKLHLLYIDAGAQIIASNTFSANRFSIQNSDYTIAEIISAGVKIAKEAVENSNTKVALDIGPLSELLEPYGDLTEGECYDIYDEIITAGVAEHPDLIFFETFMDIEMLKIAVSVGSKYSLPIFCSMTFEPVGKTLMGNSVEDMIQELSAFPISAIGLNCSNEPMALMKVIQSFRTKTDLPLIFKPNAGLPQQKDGHNYYHSDEELFTKDMLPAQALAPIYLGGCCGTAPSYIQKLKESLS